MDSSRRAVESYWRSRIIDGATSDEDKVAPVYKLEEICDLLRSSHVSIVKEVSDFILKRLDHKSPLVKQKALRLIKYAVGKSGAEFRREMQRHSVAVRQLLHYRGQPDPLKGDALNKAVRDTAQDAISAIFSEENSKPAPAQLTKRMEGFGNTNFEMRSDDKKSFDSFLSEVVDIGSATIKQGLSSLTQGNPQRMNDPGNYRSPNLHRSLTLDGDSSDRYEPVQLRNDNHGSFGGSRASAGGSWGQDLRSANATKENGNSSSSHAGSKIREERLLETIVTSGGVRLQPTRDALHVFLVEAAKLDALALSRALESKLQSPSWQAWFSSLAHPHLVRMKAVCVLEAILRKKDEEKFSIIPTYFNDNIDALQRCSESPQSSLSEKARKVLSLLDGGKVAGVASSSGNLMTAVPPVQIPDLIDTRESDDFLKAEDPIETLNDEVIVNVTATTPFTHDLLGDSLGPGGNSKEHKNEDDPFADVSFHTGELKEQAGDLFSGMNLDEQQSCDENQVAANRPELLDIFGSGGNQENSKTDVNDLLAGMSISGGVKQQVSSPYIQTEDTTSDLGNYAPKDDLRNMVGGSHSQLGMMNASSMFPPSAMPYGIPPGMVLNPALGGQPILQNNGGIGGFLTQQQLVAAMSNLQQLSNLNVQNSHVNANGSGSALPDIFHPSFPNQAPTSTMSSSKNEDSKAFDFISDHLAAARDPRRVS
ncbi:Protein MODIFIED TRANSPORT TO THE VACUOLE 1 [Linum perenne]